MTTQHKISIGGCIAIALAGAIAVFTHHQDETKLFKRYVAISPPNSFKILESERHGFREWNAFFRFRVSPGDFSKLLQCNNASLLNTKDLDSIGFASLAIQVLKHHSPETDFARDYEFYTFSPTNSVTDNYLAINRTHSDGYIVVIRY